MGSEFQNLFKRGGTPYCMKFFKERILSSLVFDLQNRAIAGIEDEICDSIIEAVNTTISEVEDLDDESFWNINFHRRMKLFLRDYVAWNHAKTMQKRVECLKKLRQTKNVIFFEFNKHMNELKETNNVVRLEEFKKMVISELDIHASLNLPFRMIVNKWPDLFPNLLDALKVFDKRM